MSPPSTIAVSDVPSASQRPLSSTQAKVALDQFPRPRLSGRYRFSHEAARKQGAEGIHVFGDPLTFIHSAKVAGLAARYQLPAIYLMRRNVLDGGLMSYGPN